VVEIDEMICIDSSRDWERTLAFQAVLEWSLDPRTDGTATMLILGRIYTSFDMGRFRRVRKLPILGEASNEKCKISRTERCRWTPWLTNGDSRGNAG